MIDQTMNVCNLCAETNSLFDKIIFIQQEMLNVGIIS